MLCPLFHISKQEEEGEAHEEIEDHRTARAQHDK